MEYAPGGGRGPRNREEGHTSPTHSLAHSLEPTHNHMPGLATVDGPADLPMCGVCPVAQPDGLYRTEQGIWHNRYVRVSPSFPTRLHISWFTRTMNLPAFVLSEMVAVIIIAGL